MTKTNKILLSLVIALAFLVGYTYRGPIASMAASPLHDNFNSFNLATTTIVTATGTLVLPFSATNGGGSYWSIVNSGSNGVSCYPLATTTGVTYGGGWWLAPGGGTIENAGVSLYSGSISCITGSGTTTLGVIAK